MNILFTLTPAFNPNDGGVQRTTYKLGKKFTELGHSVSYFSCKHKGNVEAAYGTLYHASQEGGVHNKETLNELKALLPKIKPDFVINQMPYEQQLTKTLYDQKITLNYILLGCLRNSLFSYKSNIKNIVEQLLPQPVFMLLNNKLGMFLLALKHRLKHKMQLKEILDLHDQFILLAPPNRNELEYFVGKYKSSKVSVVPNSIPEVYRGGTKKERIIVHVGRLNIQQKRSDLLLQFWEKAYAQLEDWQFVIVGDGPYKEHMEQEILEKKLPRVSMLGYQEPEPWYKKASLFVMTSAYEGFPNVILEAQSFGCVSLAFKSYDAISWIVHNKKDALLFEPYDTNAMAEAVIELSKNEKRIERMAAESKQNASKFVVDKIAVEWMALFDRLKAS